MIIESRVYLTQYQATLSEDPSTSVGVLTVLSSGIAPMRETIVPSLMANSVLPDN